MDKFNELRNKYSNFIYDKYEIKEENNKLMIYQHYIIENLTDFNTVLEFNKKYIKNNNVDNNLLNYLAFHIGLIELLSYWKCTCSKNIIINAGYLDNDQINWFKKLYFNGLGEFFYRNNINVNETDFVNITCNGKKLEFSNNFLGDGNLIPIGGGKDSIVTLEVLNSLYDKNDCFALNPKEVHFNCINVANYENKNIIVNKTYIDPKLKDLNSKGFLNGHTPFSSMLAFITYLVAYLTNKMNIILSNEGSANESNIVGTNVNHQYSKSYEFEQDFNNYTKKYFNIDIKYFSLLRPLNELTIAKLFSKYEKYHSVFKSCNLGSKNKEWLWCNNCPKCLFVFIILSPYLYKDKLINIFKDNLYEREDLLEVFLELLGYRDNKPFECVGTFDEVRYAVSLTIKNILYNEGTLPYLLDYYYKNYELVDTDIDLTKYYNEYNNLDENMKKLLEEALNE